MAIPEIWTLEAAGQRRTLAGWGVTSGTLRAGNQVADVMTLRMGRAAADADLPWAWDQELVVRRAGVVWFRGRVARTPRMLAPTDESAGYELRNVWWDLERLMWVQDWATGSATLAHPRARLGYDPTTGDRIAGRDALSAVAEVATAAGSPVTIDSGGLADGFSPVTAEANATLAQLIRNELRWHPDAVVWATYSESGTTLRMARRSAMPAVSYALGRPLSELSISPRPDLQVDAVHLSYETAVTELYLIPANPAAGDPVARAGSRRRTVFFRDEYPAGSPRTRRTLVAAMPGSSRDPAVPGSTAGEIKTHKQPIRTRPLPRTGAYDTDAVRWWFDHLGLAAYGLKTTDVKLPTSTVGEVEVHTLTIAEEFEEEVPSAVNPASRPLRRATDLKDLPRELVDGQIADWMGNKATPVSATATVAIKKSKVDELSRPRREAILALGGRTHRIDGVDFYLARAQVDVIGTDARSRVYQTPVSVTQASSPTQEQLNVINLTTVTQARARSVVSGLARRLHDARATLEWEGSLSLSDAEAGGRRHLGQVLCVTHSARPEWASMRATIQTESVDLATGRTDLEFGPPEHLGPQDRIAQRDAMLAAMDRSLASGREPDDPEGGAAPGGAGTDADSPVVGGSVSPRWQAQFIGGAAATEAWRLEQAENGKWKIAGKGRIYASCSDPESAISIEHVDDHFDFGENRWIAIKLTDMHDPEKEPTLELVSVPKPSPAITYKFSKPPDPPSCEEALFLLWEGRPGTAPEGEHGAVQHDGWWARRFPRPAALVIDWGAHEFDDQFTHIEVPVLNLF